jgi:uncharacterized membrane protein
MTRHLTRCLLAGLVALLPIGGFVFSVVWAETLIAGSWLARQPWYFPGLGLLLVAVVLYAMGLCVTTFVGRFLFARVDRLLDRLPALGQLYQTLKQLVGYGGGPDAMFLRVGLVPGVAPGVRQIGLVTQDVVVDGPEPPRCVVFVPSAPNLTTGQLLVIETSSITPLDMTVNDAMKALLSVGKTDLPLGRSAP